MTDRSVIKVTSRYSVVKQNYCKDKPNHRADFSLTNPILYPMH